MLDRSSKISSNRGVGRDLTPLFAPDSVAILGASSDATKWGNWISAQALRMSDSRKVHLINRNGETILGQPALKSLAELDGPVDLVVVTVPARGFEAAIEDSLAAGARAIIGVTAGFAELGMDGRAVQERIVRRVRSAGAVLLGPNCLGVLDTSTSLTLTSNPLPPGRIALISQSGNMALEMSGLLKARGHGFSRFVSLGNQADLNAADVIGACVDHPDTDLIALFCEDFVDGRSFVDAATAAAEAGKPVLLLAVGGSEASIRGAQSHTGSLTSGSLVVDAACRAAGIYRAASPRQLADAAATLLSFGPRAVHRVGVIADGGGSAGMASDVVESAGLSVPKFADDVSDTLRTILPPSAGVTNPVDLIGSGEEGVAAFVPVLEAVLASPEIDSALITGFFGGYEEYGEQLGRAEIEAATSMARIIRKYGKPVLMHTMRPNSNASKIMESAGVPLFLAVDDAATTLSLLDRTSARRRLPSLPTMSANPIESADYWHARELLRGAGLTFPESRLVQDAAEAKKAAAAIGYPVVLKAMGLLHKSDLGGVALGLSTDGELTQALSRMTDSLSPPSFSVEAMADLREGIEIIVGVQRDPRFGPVAMVGLGGIYTEVLADVAFALAPLDADSARNLLEGLRASALLRGVRGKPAVDLNAAGAAIAAITQVAVLQPEINELEVNPLLVTPKGAIALDARIVLRGSGNESDC
ncbi:CoA-binding protein [Mesorhizobium loti]|uniref:CoA-binding protein n=1 Tax=Rhizobium loti TaxID=381 RepID=A0A101KPA7_RHILI|nr:CoA-binding protein [Mesorhizobium loti]